MDKFALTVSIRIVTTEMIFFNIDAPLLFLKVVRRAYFRA
jgi:hypothetical protein